MLMNDFEQFDSFMAINHSSIEYNYDIVISIFSLNFSLVNVI